jgi:uncharacterized phage-associated protein
MFTSIEIGNYFIKKSLDTGKELTPMKLIKMVYIAHGWHLALTSQPLLSEAVHAWQYGPVITSLYEKIKGYGKHQIDSLIILYQNEESIIPIVKDENILPILNRVWDVYSDYNGLQLSSLTHQDGTPWEVTTRQANKNSIIANDLIKNYYQTKLNAAA